MEILITGVSGFIGSHLAKALINFGYTVLGIDNFETGNIRNIQGIIDNPQFKLYKIDILNETEVINVFKNNNIEIVFHFAALPRVNYSFLYPEKTANANIIGTISILKNAAAFRVKKFIFASSSSVYGEQKKFPLAESFIPQPISPYAIQKLAAESFCKLYYNQYGLQTICLRYFNVFGGYFLPIDTRFNCVIPNLINGLIKENQVTLNDSGNQVRDFTFIEDVTNANILAIQTENAIIFGQSINVGAGVGTSINDLLLALAKKLGKSNYLIKNVNSRYTEPSTVIANNELAGEILKWVPKVSLDEGLTKTIKFFQG